jgi:hypothetical protein
MEKRLQNQHLPPIAVIGSSSIVVGSVPWNFTWQSRNVEENDSCEIPVDQTNEFLRSAGNPGDPDRTLEVALSSEVKQSTVGRDFERKKRTQCVDQGKVVGPAHKGLSIEELFSHSYIPPSASRSNLSLPSPLPPPDGFGSPPLGFGIPRRSTIRRVLAIFGDLDPKQSSFVEFSHQLLTLDHLWRSFRDQWRRDLFKGVMVEMWIGPGIVVRCKRISSAGMVVMAIRDGVVKVTRGMGGLSLTLRRMKAVKLFRKKVGDNVMLKLKVIEI